MTPDNNGVINLSPKDAAIVFTSDNQVQTYIPKDTDNSGEIGDNELLVMALNMHLRNADFVKQILTEAKRTVLDLQGDS